MTQKARRRGWLDRVGVKGAFMKRMTKKTLSQMVEAIVREVDPEQVYLFGSRATGRADDDSDVDLLIVERDPFGGQRNRWQELRRIRRALSSFRIPKDILVYSRDEFTHWKGSLNHIVGVCRREGRLLYESA